MGGSVYNRDYYLKNRDRIRRQSKEYRLQNPEKIAAYQAEYRRVNPEKRARSMRSAKLKWKFGITQERYDEILIEQHGKCALCDQTCVTGAALAVDHDHKTGAIRGLLCLKCNVGLGIYEKFDVPRVRAYIAGSRMDSDLR